MGGMLVCVESSGGVMVGCWSFAAERRGKTRKTYVWLRDFEPRMARMGGMLVCVEASGERQLTGVVLSGV
jgi:hypothetical protein